MKFTLRMNSWLQRCCFVAVTLLMSTFALGQCNDTTACNYSQTDTTNVGCTYPGCTDFSACNYDAAAGCSDTSCEYTPTFSLTFTLNEFDSIITYQGVSYDVAGIYYVIVADADTNTSSCYDTLVTLTIQDVDILGCTDISACNYNELAGTSDSSCLSLDACGDCGGNGVLGCMVEFACNYDPNATCPNNELCSFPQFGFVNDSISSNDSSEVLIAGVIYSAGGQYIDTLIAANGCDSILTIFIVDTSAAGCLNPQSCQYNPFVGINNDSLCLTFYGCLDATACNYDTTADCDDGSCLFPGCMDSTACNYDMTAGCEDGSCLFPGCIETIACNYDMTAGCDDGSCLFPGCIDTIACNYDALASCSDASLCLFPGCMDTTACNYNASAGCSDSSCTYFGCTDTLACNYDATAVCSDTTCEYTPTFSLTFTLTDSIPFTFQGISYDSAAVYEIVIVDADTNTSSCYDTLVTLTIQDVDILGCTDISACNYNELAGTSDSSCTYPGCMDTTACNYDSAAGCDNQELCLSFDACGDCGGNGVLGCMDETACNFDSTATCAMNDMCNFSVITELFDTLGADLIIVGSDTLNSAGVYEELYAGVAANGCDSLMNVLIVDPATVGCNNDYACNYDPTVGIGNDSLCVFPGCMDSTACNYDASASCPDNSLCTFYGCMDTTACNYDALASCSDASLCLFPGCDDTTACNFDAGAGCGDQSLCEYSGCLDPLATNYLTAACNDTCEYSVATCSNLNLTFDQGLCYDNGANDGTYGPEVTLIFNYTGDCTVSTVTIDGGTPIDVTQFNLANDSIISAGIINAGTSSTFSFTLSDGTSSADFTVEANDCSGDPTICDCAGTELTIAVTTWIGDTFADSGLYVWGGQLVDFNCATWGYDCGDIAGAPSEDPYDVCGDNLPPAADTINMTGFGCGIDTTVRISELSSNSTFSAFPNPTNGRLNIVTNGAYENRVVRIFDQTGNLVYTERRAMSPGVAEMLDLSFLPAGTYHVQLVGSKEVQNTSVILQR